MAEKTFQGMGNLIRLLPTGTTFVFQFLNPVLTNSGECSTTNKVFTAVLIGICSFTCAFSCFTDSYKDSKGKRRYGIVTRKGLWPRPSDDEEQAKERPKYKVKVGDFVRAALNVVVFATVALLDGNTVRCLYPSFEDTQKTLIVAMPVLIGMFSSGVFAIFPTKRNGIGYPPNEEEEEK